MSDFEKIVKKYAAFEKKVMKQISLRLRKYCAACEGGCCTPTICQETTESPLLIRLRKTFQPGARYQKGRGWLRNDGCILQVGRPPICHEFLCNEVERAHAVPVERYVLKALCHLVSHMGKAADGTLHLVEISSERDLHNVSLKRFTTRLHEAEAALNVARSFLSNDHLEPKALAVLARVYPLPSSLRKKG